MGTTLGETLNINNIVLCTSNSTIFNFKYTTHMTDKKNKKPRDVSYSQGYKLIEKHGYDTVKNL
tara:strand:- start:30203 stop:30394 length:192 start_codon:yes stop_codon:yes gene_type:complete